MKKLIALVAAVCSAAVVWAEQLDHWEVNGSTMTDGVWTFTCARGGSKATPDTGVYGFTVQGCTGYPSEVSTLDFDKPLVNLTPNDSRSYVITAITPAFNGSEAGQRVGVLKLPTHGYDFNMGNKWGGGSGFKNCTNLERIEPFLPVSCVSIGRGTFQGCTKLASPLVWKNGSGMSPDADSSTWEIFEGTAIPSVDLSGSSITRVDRAWFNNCTALKWAKLPETLLFLSGGTTPFNCCTALEKVEFYSVPDGFGSAFAGCTGLSEVHFYDCEPTATPAANLFVNTKNTGLLTTWLHVEDSQVEAWAQYAQDGVIDTSSTWSKALAGNDYAKRPLVRYVEKHVQIVGDPVDANVLDGQNGVITVGRGDGEPVVGDLVVNYQVGGEAEADVHFRPLSGSVTIPNGQSSADIEITGLYTGAAYEKSLTITLTDGDYTLIEGKTAATITITSGYREVSVAKVRDASRPLGQVGFFKVSRGENDSTLGDLEVALSFEGTAVNGETYRTIPQTVTIPAGQKEIEVEVFPLDDQNVLEDSTVIVSVAEGLYSVVGEAATVNILFGDGSYGCWRIYKEGSQAYLTDGMWTFKCALQGVRVSTDDAYRLDVGAATVWPGVVSPLDFTKGFIHEYDGKTYKIGQWAMGFGKGKNNNREVEVTDAGLAVGEVKLLDGDHDAIILTGAFAGCSNMVFNLETMPKNIITIQSTAFLFSSVSGALSAPRLTYVQGSAFRGCPGVTALTASNIVQILDSAFQDATGLVSVDLGPDEDCVLEKIGSSAFQGCTSLESFTPFLPSSLDVLNARGAFMNCSNLETPLVFKGSDLGEDHKGWNGTQMFENCAKIPSADLSESTITALRREAFNGCVALKEVKLPATFVEFGNPNTAVDSQEYYPNINTDPFNGCSGIKLYLNSPKMPVKNSSTDVNVPMNIAGISEIVISANMTELEDGAFSKAEYSNLTEIKFLGAKPETIGADLFANQKAGQLTAYVPRSKVATWKPVATDEIITKTKGEWVSGTAQQIRTWADENLGLMLLVR